MRFIGTIFVCLATLGLAGCASKEPTTNEVIEDQLSGPEFRTVETDQGVVVMLVNPLLFAFDSDELTEESRNPIAYIARVLNTPGVQSRQVHVNGYSDSVGNEDYNLDLSRRRAEAVAKELVYNQVAAERVLYNSFGEANPIAPNVTDDGSDNPEGRTLNRRVEIVILNP
ncbi:OmpA family protein [Pelagibius sp. Alg239-R121]|uniref:OmpA family protein n=1 Tax=Pelagibius sp. Alg239-R121 TaxID=2993448 RepID=UPI0024A71ACB|nr:OmpA family protein [Pelagibius sp. Alg239-R121]